VSWNFHLDEDSIEMESSRLEVFIKAHLGLRVLGVEQWKFYRKYIIGDDNKMARVFVKNGFLTLEEYEDADPGYEEEEDPFHPLWDYDGRTLRVQDEKLFQLINYGEEEVIFRRR